jgi:glutathione S-transferase
MVLFESGAIVLHVGRQSAALLPADQAGQARATARVFAALNSVEPFVIGLIEVDIFSREEAWAKQSRPRWEGLVKKRLADLAERLAGRDWLEDRFTAGDLMMATVLRVLRHTDLDLRSRASAISGALRSAPRLSKGARGSDGVVYRGGCAAGGIRADELMLEPLAEGTERLNCPTVWRREN